MSKSPDEIFNEAVQNGSYDFSNKRASHRNCWSCCDSDSNYENAFEAGGQWLKENPHLIPSVKALVLAAIHFKREALGTILCHEDVIRADSGNTNISVVEIKAKLLVEALKAFGDRT